VRMKRVMMVMACALAVGIAGTDVADAKPKGKNCKKLCKSEIKGCRDQCIGFKGRERRDCRKSCKADILAQCEANPDENTCVGATTTTTTHASTTTVPVTTTTSSSSTTTTTQPYGSASRAFLDPVASLLQ
jgi:hypothetical protein